jgi:hypothetical protein
VDGIYISTNDDDFGDIILLMTNIIDHPYKKTCPKCKSGYVIRIAYGLPGPCGLEGPDEDEVELGGCVVMSNDPHLICKTCGYRWDRHDGL